MIRFKKYSLARAHKALPFRDKFDSKTKGGKTLIIAGSNGKWGAAILCAQAAARCGAGYVYLYDPLKKFPIIKNPDFLIKNKKDLFLNYQAVAIGPGFIHSSLIKKFILQLTSTQQPNVVLDAEALNVLAKFKKFPKIPPSWILTPHEGELSRLLNVPSKKIKLNRIKYITKIQKKAGCIIILKGARSLIADGKTIWEIQSGNQALAKAGTGDVLTGMVAGFLSQNILPVQAACIATYLHGLIADQWVNHGNDHLSLLASDLISEIPKTLNFIRQK